MTKSGAQAELELMEDSVRAASMGQFKVTKDQLIALIEKYRQRKYIDDLDYIAQELQGMDNLLEALDINVSTGISINSTGARERCFGTHFKEPPVLTPFWQLLIAALDDFMLKILIVAAIVQLAIELTFAEEGEKLKALVEGSGILVAVAIVSLVSAWSDYSKEK